MISASIALRRSIRLGGTIYGYVGFSRVTGIIQELLRDYMN